MSMLGLLATVARGLRDRFTDMVRRGPAEGLSGWLGEAEASALASFGRGLRADQAAVAAALLESWSNGQTEDQINRLKTLKRQLYGRANIDLLKARMSETKIDPPDVLSDRSCRHSGQRDYVDRAQSLRRCVASAQFAMRNGQSTVTL